MPGIASDRSPGIQISPIASIGSDIPPTPAIGDLMDAFKQGFITVDDLQRRNVQNISANDQLKTQLQSSDFQRKLAPGAFANAQAGQALQADQIRAAGQVLPGATQLTLSGQELAQQEADRQAALTSDDSARHAAAVADATKRSYIDTFGHEPPKTVDILAPLPADTFDVWLQKTHGKDLVKEVNDFDPGVPDPKDHDQIILDKVNAFQSGFPLNSPEDNVARAKYANALEIEVKSTPTPDQLRAQFENQAREQLREDPAIRTEYETYRRTQADNKDSLKPGSPEYTEVLRQRIQDAQDKAALRAAKITALPKVFEAQAAAPGKAIEAQAKAQGDVLAELHRSEALKRFEPQFEAFDKLDAIRNSGRVPTSADDVTTLYLFVKLLDPTSAVREGEVDLTKSTNPYVVQTYNRLKSAFDSKNKILGDTARGELLAAMDSLKAGALKTAAPEIKRISNIAIDRGVPLDQVFTGPYRAILSGAGSAPAAGSAAPPNGAKRVVQNGVTFEWNGSKYAAIP